MPAPMLRSRIEELREQQRTLRKPADFDQYMRVLESKGFLEGVMNLLKNDLLMRKTGDRRRTELTEESASQCGLSAEFITPSRERIAYRFVLWGLFAQCRSFVNRSLL